MNEKQANFFRGIGKTLKKVAPAATGIIKLLGAKEIAAVQIGGAVLKSIFKTSDERELATRIENATPEQLIQLEEIGNDLAKEELLTERTAIDAVTERWRIDANSEHIFTKLFRPGSATGVLLYSALLCPFSLYMVGEPDRVQLMLYWITFWGALATTMVNSYFLARSSEKKTREKFSTLLNP